MFEVGQRVVCVDNRNNRGKRWLPGTEPSVGCIYVVREVGTTLIGNPGIKVHGLCLRNKYEDVWYPDAFYRATRFEPLPKKATSIEVFQRLLLPTSEKV